MKDPFGHGSNVRGAAMRGIKVSAIERHRAAHGNKAVFTKFRTKRAKLDAGKTLREGSGHKSNRVGTHAAMGGSYAYGKGDGNGY